MIVKETKLKGCFVIESKLFKDQRGYFFESFNQQNFEKEVGFNINFVQDNQAFSNKGIVRGLHFQTGEAAQAKLVRVIRGEVLDVAVDLRKDSETYGQYFSIILSEENNKQLFVPRGFAHGYSVLRDETIFAYKCDNYYNKNAEGGVFFNDQDLNIDWKLNKSEYIVSEKDMILPKLKEI